VESLPRIVAAALVAAALGLRGNAATLEFSGYVAGDAESRFVIFDAASKQRSGLLLLGQRFGGYQITGFDRVQETLTLQRGGEVLRLKLKPPMAMSAAYAATPLSSKPAAPVPGWKNDLYPTRAEGEKNLKKIQSLIGDAPLPYPVVAPGK
jgi:hypothetical protein